MHFPVGRGLQLASVLKTKRAQFRRVVREALVAIPLSADGQSGYQYRPGSSGLRLGGNGWATVAGGGCRLGVGTAEGDEALGGLPCIKRVQAFTDQVGDPVNARNRTRLADQLIGQYKCRSHAYKYVAIICASQDGIRRRAMSSALGRGARGALLIG